MQTNLETLLDAARDAILSGDLDHLAGLTPKVEAEAESLARLDVAEAGRLRQKAERNMALLQAATRGIRAAQGRLGEINAGPTLTTYDARGQKAALLPASTHRPHRI